MLLKRGMSGPDILNLEQIVSALGFAGVPVTGTFDEKLENVIKYIQKSHGLNDDGKVGDKTLALIDSLYEPEIPNFQKEIPHNTPASFITGTPLDRVHPRLKDGVIQLIEQAAEEEYKLIVTQGLRTFAEQHKLFLQRPRVTKADAGQSYHNYGLAVDLAFVIGGKINWDDKYYSNIGRWASRVNLEWGGHWHFKDTPHVQIPNLAPTGKLMVVYQMTQGTVDNKVQAVWNKYVL